MKQGLHYSVLLLFLLLLVIHSSMLSARSMVNNQELQVEATAKRITTQDSTGELEGSTLSAEELMGLDHQMCENGDEECLERRIIAEAHLDYIYTQRHKP
ncbi:hypothetical protein Tsubulata_014953 [Turnera subulata]|uniref:Phytosulfokine n=1 Tax=Turnera subulata TaxID=218843 RepID=A0A9Q0FBJ8_9ROSI|nr:hypothetical protein Tsubulata_014953 [Turnera subulata]